MLHAIYATGTYNFIYNAQVVDKNSTAVQRANEFNLIYVPTCYFDAGFRILIGGTSTWSYYQSRLNDASNRTVTPLNMITAIQWLGGNDVKVRVRVGNGVPVNVAPTAPNAPTGITKGLINVNYDFTALSTDGDGDDLFFQWDFGDGTVTDWLGPFAEGSSVIQPYAWTDKGTFDVKVRTKDVYEEATAWSPVLSVSMGCCVVPGDFNHSGGVDITDLTDMVDFMFAGGTPAECEEEGNTNGLDSIDITDLTFLVDFMFAGGAAPPDCP